MQCQWSEKKKLGTQEKRMENRLPLSTIISRLCAPQSVDRFSTLQVILVDGCPVLSAAGWSASPKKYMLPSLIAPIFGNVSSQWRRIVGS
jgi:hypothetical protein